MIENYIWFQKKSVKVSNGNGNNFKMGDEKDATASTDEKPELTKFGKFCQRHGINSNLIMLKITLFVMYGGRMF